MNSPLICLFPPPRPTLPFELSRKQVLDLLFKEHCLGHVLDLCAEGSVSIHRVIKETDLELGPLVGKGGTAVVYRAEYNGTTVAYKEFIEGAPLKEFYREVAMMRCVFLCESFLSVSLSHMLGVVYSSIRAW